jgi:hypothetical protein
MFFTIVLPLVGLALFVWAMLYLGTYGEKKPWATALALILVVFFFGGSFYTLMIILIENFGGR